MQLFKKSSQLRAFFLPIYLLIGIDTFLTMYHFRRYASKANIHRYQLMYANSRSRESIWQKEKMLWKIQKKEALQEVPFTSCLRQQSAIPSRKRNSFSNMRQITNPSSHPFQPQPKTCMRYCTVPS